MKNLKINKNFIIGLSGVLLVFFLIALVLCIANGTDGLINNIFIAQLIFLALAACSVIIYNVIPSQKPDDAEVNGITKIVVLSDTNSLIDEFLLVGRTSCVIGKSETVCFGINPEELLEKEYAVINRVESNWYVERVSDERSVGYKPCGQAYVYKLKTGICYKLHTNDILYIGKERLLVL